MVRGSCQDLKECSCGQEETAELGTCSICLGEYEEGDEMMALPDCSHVFHADCMSSWLRVRHTCSPRQRLQRS